MKTKQPKTLVTAAAVLALIVTPMTASDSRLLTTAGARQIHL
jgi:hypothetical protein